MVGSSSGSKCSYEASGPRNGRLGQDSALDSFDSWENGGGVTHSWVPSWTEMGIRDRTTMSQSRAGMESGKPDNFSAKLNSLEGESRANHGINEIYVRLSVPFITAVGLYTTYL